MKVKLTTEGINDVIGMLSNYGKNLHRIETDLIDNMIADGESYARSELGHYDTGDTLGSLTASRTANKGTIKVGENAVWCEFGAGVYHNTGNQHPLVGKIDGIVPIGTYGKGNGKKDGWVFASETVSSAHFKPFGKTKDGKDLYYTHGILGTHFMYKTALMLRQNYTDMAKEIIND